MNIPIYDNEDEEATANEMQGVAFTGIFIGVILLAAVVTIVLVAAL